MKSIKLCLGATAVCLLLVAGCSGAEETGNDLRTNAAEPVAGTTRIRAAGQEPAGKPDNVGSAAAERPGGRDEAGVGETVGGDGSPIRLSPISSAQFESADLPGELGCDFQAGHKETLLVAMGDVASNEPAVGVVNLSGEVERVSAPGGFDGMLKGARFVGKSKTIVVERTASQPVGGGESPPYPARLTYQRADGAQRRFEGLWSCGP